MSPASSSSTPCRGAPSSPRRAASTSPSSATAVTSPGGTSAEALYQLERGGLRDGGERRRVGGVRAHASAARGVTPENRWAETAVRRRTPTRAGVEAALYLEGSTRPALWLWGPAILHPPCQRTHLIGMLLGTEEDWPTAFETLVSRLGTITDAAGRRHRIATERITMEPFDLEGPPALRARDRPPGLLVPPAARMAQEGRVDERRIPAQQPVHVPVDGEARGLLRDDPPGAQGPADGAGAAQEPARQRALPVHVSSLQPAVST